MKKILTAICFALLASLPSQAAWQISQVGKAPAITPFSTSIPAGNFTQGTNGNSSIVANSDGTTNGVTCTGSCYSPMSTLVSFPSNDTCTFSVQAFVITNPGVTDANSVSVNIDGEFIPMVSPSSVNNWWAVGVTNTSPAQSYNFQVPLLAGIHQVTLGMGIAQNTAQQAASQSFHIDRVNITCPGTGIPTEPSGSRDPYNFPLSANDFWNTAIGSGASWSAATDADNVNLISTANSHTISAVINSGSNSVPIWQGTSSNPFGIFRQPSTSSWEMWMAGTQPFYLHIPTSISVAPGSDASIAIADQTNERYFYMGADPGTIFGNSAQFGVTVGNGGLFDGYRLYSAADELKQIPGLIRSADITAGVISHTLTLGLTYVQMSSGNVNSTGGTATTITGNGWPVTNFDFTCFNGGPPTSCTGNIQPGSVIGIPSTYNCSGHSLTAGGVMLCLALQNYGAIQTVQAGSPTSPQTTLYAEQALSGNSTLTNMASDFSGTLLAQLRIMRNNTPTNFLAGTPTYAKGGGTPLVAQLAGLNFTYPSIFTSTLPSGYGNGTVPPAVPYAFTYGFGASSLTVPIGGPLPVGSTGVLIVSANGAITAGTDSSGDTWTVRRTSTANTGQTITFLDVINKAHALTTSGTITLTGSGVTTLSYSGVGFQSGVVSGADVGACATSNSTSGFTVSTGTMSQSGDIVIGGFGVPWFSPSFESLPGLAEGLSGWAIWTDELHWGTSYELAPSTTSVAYAPTFSAGTANTSGCVQAYKTP